MPEDKFPVVTNAAHSPETVCKCADFEKRIAAIERQLQDVKRFRQQLRAGLMQAAKECEDKR
jgi:hypothetical protein